MLSTFETCPENDKWTTTRLLEISMEVIGNTTNSKSERGYGPPTGIFEGMDTTSINQHSVSSIEQPHKQK
jgi:hypothetical protein